MDLLLAIISAPVNDHRSNQVATISTDKNKTNGLPGEKQCHIFPAMLTKIHES